MTDNIITCDGTIADKACNNPRMMVWIFMKFGTDIVAWKLLHTRTISFSAVGNASVIDTENHQVGG
jgi:hypothetical protein